MDYSVVFSVCTVALTAGAWAGNSDSNADANKLGVYHFFGLFILASQYWIEASQTRMIFAWLGCFRHSRGKTEKLSVANFHTSHPEMMISLLSGDHSVRYLDLHI